MYIVWHCNNIRNNSPDTLSITSQVAQYSPKQHKFKFNCLIFYVTIHLRVQLKYVIAILEIPLTSLFLSSSGWIWNILQQWNIHINYISKEAIWETKSAPIAILKQKGRVKESDWATVWQIIFIFRMARLFAYVIMLPTFSDSFHTTHCDSTMKKVCSAVVLKS